MPARSIVTPRDALGRRSSPKPLRLVEAQHTPGGLPRSLGRYTLHAEIAFGGMGTVHLGMLAGAAGFRRPVAIKHLHGYPGQGVARGELRQEARLGSRVRHPNVVPVLDLVEADNTLFLVMEFVLGETLARLLEKQRLPVAVVVAIVGDILQGLHAAHTAGDSGQALGIVHRDVSPQNIQVGADGVARILDFGVAKCLGTEERLSEPTEIGLIKGKLGYIAPEQLLSEPLDARVDVFAAGIVLWEALTGRRVFKGADPVHALLRLAEQGIPPPSAYNREVTPKLDAVLARALEANPEARFQSAQEFAEHLRIATERAPAARVARYVEKIAATALGKQRHLLQSMQVPARAVRSPQPLAHQTSAHEVSTSSLATRLYLEPRRSSRRGSFWRDRRLNTTIAIGGFVLAGLVCCFSKLSQLEQRALGAVAQERAATDRRGEPLPANGAGAGLVNVPGLAHGATSGASTASAAVDARPPSATPKPQPSAPAKVARARPKSSLNGRMVSASNPCNPLYRVDSKGIKRMKRECL